MIHFEIYDLNKQQAGVTIITMDATTKLLNPDSAYTPFGPTMIGAGGSGKSHLTNTFVSIIGQYT